MLTLPTQSDLSQQTNIGAADLTLYALGHTDELLSRVSTIDNIIPIPLHRVRGQACFAEFRFFKIAPRIETDYVGFVSCRWADKFPSATPIEKLYELSFSPQTVFAPAPTNVPDWVAHCGRVHPGLAALLPTLAQSMRLPLLPKAPTLWTANFICHRQVWESYVVAFHAACRFVEKQWGTQPPFDTGRYDANRKIAYLLERTIMIYFAARSDLNIVKV